MIYLSYPTCVICGKKTSNTEDVGAVEVPMCKSHQIDITTRTKSSYSNKQMSTIATTDSNNKDNQTSITPYKEENDIPERPYYGMLERSINSTKIGKYSYKENSTVTPEGNGSSYTFIVDARHALLVKTASGVVVMIQYIEDGKKVLWSETSTGFHDWQH
jgi:hypothetical protein